MEPIAYILFIIIFLVLGILFYIPVRWLVKRKTHKINFEKSGLSLRITSSGLALNKFKCPLTAIAARYTSDRMDNFDIYLPLSLAKYNKEIFGTLYIAGIIYTIIMWWVR